MAENGEDRPKVIHIRVQGDRRVVEEMATKIGEFLEGAGYELIEQTGMFPLRLSETDGKVFVTVR